MRTLLALSLIFLASCSTVRFKSSGKVPVYGNSKNIVKLMKRSKKEHLEFYLWGAFPREQVIEVDEIAEELGFYRGSSIYISQYRDGFDTLKTLFSLGLYSPMTVEVSLVGEKYSE